MKSTDSLSTLQLRDQVLWTIALVVMMMFSGNNVGATTVDAMEMKIDQSTNFITNNSNHSVDSVNQDQSHGMIFLRLNSRAIIVGWKDIQNNGTASDIGTGFDIETAIDAARVWQDFKIDDLFNSSGIRRNFTIDDIIDTKSNREDFQRYSENKANTNSTTWPEFFILSVFLFGAIFCVFTVIEGLFAPDTVDHDVELANRIVGISVVTDRDLRRRYM